MKIKDGYNSEELEIRINSNAYGRKTLEVWFNSRSINNGKEILSYMTLDEAFDLKREIEEAIKSLFEV